jgi:hypothetical protein
LENKIGLAEAQISEITTQKGSAVQQSSETNDKLQQLNTVKNNLQQQYDQLLLQKKKLKVNYKLK